MADDAPVQFPPEQGWIARGGKALRTRHALWLTGRYFVSKDAWAAWALLALAVTLQFTGVYVAVASNAFDKTFFDAIGAKAVSQLPHLVAMFLILGAASAINAWLGEYVRSILIIRWRRWLAEDYTGRWLSRDRFYAIERGTLVENPDQRISEDIRLFVEGTVLLVLGFLSVATTTITFSIVLWKLSQPIDLNVVGIPLLIPGDMVWYAIIYTLIGTVALYRFGQPLVRRKMQQQHYEADFRYHLVSVRRNAEQVALAALQTAEWRRLRELYERIKRNFMGLIWVRLLINIATSLFLEAKHVLPILLVLPRYFAGAITMGDMMQTRSAFQMLSQSLSWFIQVYPTASDTLAALNRLYILDSQVEQLALPGIAVHRAPDTAIRAQALHLDLPTGEPLVTIGDWTVAPGQRWLVRGPSGAGKSSLLRAIAGIWPEGMGEISLPRDAKIMFVPQRSYLANGTLRSVLAFPHDATHFSEAQCVDALHRARLGKFVSRLEEPASWDDIMSPGEQQRVAFARILLNQPTHLFLDEATSALDPDNAQAMYELLDGIEGITLVSVVHSTLLDRFHGHRLDIGDGAARQSRISD